MRHPSAELMLRELTAGTKISLLTHSQSNLFNEVGQSSHMLSLLSAFHTHNAILRKHVGVNK